MLQFTPKKFINAIELNEKNLTFLVKNGIDRSYFIPRYKEGSHKIKDLNYKYRKGISLTAVDKIATVLIKVKLFEEEDREMIIDCFFNDNFDNLLPDYLR